MDHLTEFQEPGFVGSEAEVTPLDRGLRILGRIIARHLINSRHDSKNDDKTTSDRRTGSNYDEGLSRI